MKKSDKAIVRPRDREATCKILIDAVGEVLAEKGFTGLGVNAVARQAGIDKVLIYRYFDGLPGLIQAFGQQGDFWPTIDELAGGDIESFKKLTLEEKLNALGRNFLKGIRRRPLTQEIMAWEMVQRSKLTEELDTVRENRMLTFSEMFLPGESTDIDLQAVISIIGAGVSYLVCRARFINVYNDINLDSEQGWQRIEKAIEQIVKGVLTRL